MCEGKGSIIIKIVQVNLLFSMIFVCFVEIFKFPNLIIVLYSTAKPASDTGYNIWRNLWAGE